MFSLSAEYSPYIQHTALLLKKDHKIVIGVLLIIFLHSSHLVSWLDDDVDGALIDTGLNGGTYLAV